MMVRMYMVVLGVIYLVAAAFSACNAQSDIVLENKYLKYVIAANGKNAGFIDKVTEKNYLDTDKAQVFSRIKKENRYFNASSVSYTTGKLTVQYGTAGVSAVIGVRNNNDHFVFEVSSVSDPVDELIIIDIPHKFGVDGKETYTGCALALNLQTNVEDIPGPGSPIAAACYARYGIKGAKVAVIGCPKPLLRDILKNVVKNAPELPKSNLGGPWAAEAKINRGTYIIDTTGVTEKNADKWIEFARGLGASQIDLHKTFRWGDFAPYTNIYPNGKADIKNVINKLRAAGLTVGMHNYAFFIDKTSPYVTPVPDPRLAKDATFALKSDIDSAADIVGVNESTEKMFTVTSFHTRNSVTIQIDNELIVYSNIDKTPGSYAFTKCRRGAYGTKAAPHKAGAKVYHLKECFDLFVPDPESTLFTEIAHNIAATANEYGFDMLYFDAIDADDIFAGTSESWYYGSKFIYEVAKKLKRPVLMEMSVYHHHFWVLRSRVGAWDTSTRSHKGFTDIHIALTENGRNMLPSNFGWTRLLPWNYHDSDPLYPAQLEPTFQDDIEYLMCKCLGWDAGLSYIAMTPETVDKMPLFKRYAPLIAKYEELRQSGYFPESMREKLRVPGDEFKLEQPSVGKWSLRPVQYERHKVNGMDEWSNVWVSRNKFGKQPAKLRIQSLLGVGDYDGAGSFVLEDFSNPGSVFAVRAEQSDVSADLIAVCDNGSAPVGKFSALSGWSDGKSAWCKMEKTFSPLLDLSSNRGLGIWVHGDGNGQILSVQFNSPKAVKGFYNHHYIKIDFKGWRYYPLVEPEGATTGDYSWPDITNRFEVAAYGCHYPMQYNNIETLTFWYINLPKGKQVECLIRPVRAIKVQESSLKNPRVTINGQTIAFPVDLDSGSYIEFYSMSDCKLYGKDGAFVKDVIPTGIVPKLNQGDNHIDVHYDYSPGSTARAYVTVISTGEPE